MHSPNLTRKTMNIEYKLGFIGVICKSINSKMFSTFSCFSFLDACRDSVR